MKKTPQNIKTFKINLISDLETKILFSKTIESTTSSWQLIFVEKETVEIQSKNYSGIISTNQMFLLPQSNNYTIKSVDNKKACVLFISFESDSKELMLLSSIPITVPISIQNHLYRGVKEYSFIKPSLENEENESSCPFCSAQLLYSNLEYFFIMEIRKRLLNVNYNLISKYPSYHKVDLGNLIGDYIDKHINENITNQQLCKEFCINRTTLCKVFRETYGIPLVKYVNQAKIQIAKNLIREGEMNYTEIADYLSFSCIHYFCKTFIKYENMTPTEYSKTVTSYVDKKKKK